MFLFKKMENYQIPNQISDGLITFYPLKKRKIIQIYPNHDDEKARSAFCIPHLASGARQDTSSFLLSNHRERGLLSAHCSSFLNLLKQIMFSVVRLSILLLQIGSIWGFSNNTPLSVGRGVVFGRMPTSKTSRLLVKSDEGDFPPEESGTPHY